MAEQTKIEWADRTFSPWEGCQKVGPGCDHCYAETRNARYVAGDDPARGTAPNWGPGAPRRVMSDSYWRNPWRWDAQAKDEGVMSSVFPSLCDPFDNAAPEGQRERFANVILGTPNLRWLLLTKRIGNAHAMLRAMFPDGTPPNVWLGATMVNQDEVRRDMPKLLSTPAAGKFVSIEPMLGPIDLLGIDTMAFRGCEKVNALGGRGLDFMGGMVRHLPRVDWIIAGGESGPGARPSHPDWYRSLRFQCHAAGTPFLFKRWGEWHADALAYTEAGTGLCPPPRMRIGKKASGRLLDGVEHNGFPW